MEPVSDTPGSFLKAGCRPAAGDFPPHSEYALLYGSGPCPGERRMDRGLIESIRAAVDASPEDVALRLHLAELLLRANQTDEALAQLGRVLQLDPTCARAVELIAATREREPVPSTEFDWEGLERELGGLAPAIEGE